MPENHIDTVRQTIAGMPQWLRVELSATDPILRARAEDTLSAMIVAAIGETDESAAGSPPPHHGTEPAASTSV